MGGMVWRGAWRGMLAWLGMALLLAGCSTGLGTSSPPTPTPIPPTPTPVAALASSATSAITIPATESSISLGTYQAAAVQATASALVLAGAPQGGIASTPAGFTELDTVPLAGGTPKMLAKATASSTGTARGIISFIAAGNWVAYVEQDAQGGEWELHAANITSGQDLLIDSAMAEHGSGLLPQTYATDGATIVWGVPVAGENVSLLHAEDLATGMARVLVTAPGITFGSILLTQGLLFYQEYAYSTSGNAITSWLWWLTQPKPAQIPATIHGTIALNTHFIVWDDSNTQMLSYYDIIAGQTTTGWKGCITPILSLDRPFVACTDTGNNQYLVVRIPAGTDAAFGANAGGGLGTGDLQNGKVYWIPEPGSLVTNSIVDVITLPAQ